MSLEKKRKPYEIETIIETFIVENLPITHPNTIAGYDENGNLKYFSHEEVAIVIKPYVEPKTITIPITSIEENNGYITVNTNSITNVILSRNGILIDPSLYTINFPTIGKITLADLSDGESIFVKYLTI